MPLPLIVGTGWDADILTISLIGQLDPVRVPEVRHVLFQCQAECPRAVLVDLAGLTVDSDLPLTVFAAVARESATWLCVPLLPYGPAGALADRVDGLRYLHLHTDREHALAALGPPVPADSAIRADLPFSSAALNLARDLAARACQDWGMVPHCGEAELIVSELVANALRHADPPLRLVVARRGPDLQIVVRDGSSLRPDPPARTGPSRLRDRGLQLIDAFATVWGSVPTLGGKAVWATLRT